MVLILLVGTSIFLQFIAAIQAIRLIRLTNHRMAWLFISFAMLLMAFRRMLPFSHALAGNGHLVDPLNESSALVISILLTIGMVKIVPFFSETRQANAAKLEVETTLRENEEKLSQAYEVGNIGVWKNDLLTGDVEFDERARQHYGFKTTRTTLSEVLARVHPEDVERLKAEIQAAVSTVQAAKIHTEYRVIHDDGQVRWLTIHGKMVFRGEGAGRQAVLGFGTSQDVTQRKLAQERLVEANETLSKAYGETIEGWTHALDLRDHETEGHARRVTELTVQMAGVMGIGEEEQVHWRRGALLHDIGKFGIPDHILLKPAALDPQEWEMMKQHPQFAHDLLAPISFLQPALDIPYGHHERWDGSGYPRGLKGEEIPLAARIFAVIDVWDALTSDRPYRRAWSKEETIAYLKKEAGCQFDPEIVNTFIAFLTSRHV